MKQVHKRLLPLLSATLLLTACQAKTSQTIVSQPEAPKQEVTVPSQNKVSETAKVASKTKVQTPVEQAKPATSQAQVTQLAEPPIKAVQTEWVTSDQATTPQVAETTYEPLPDNISTLNSQVEEGAPDWVITPETTETSTDDGKSLILANGEKLVWAEDSPTDKPIVNFSENLVGTWTYSDEHSRAIITIAPDGKVHNRIEYPEHEGSAVEYSGQLNQFAVEGESLYRSLDEGGHSLIPATGFGGYFVKYDYGYSVLNDNQISIHIWNFSGTQDRATYDYANNTLSSWTLTRQAE